jgi:hypothetical protein
MTVARPFKAGKSESQINPVASATIESIGRLFQPSLTRLGEDIDAASPALKACHYPNFCAKWMFTSSACGAGDRIKPGVKRGSAEPQEYGVSAHQAREAQILCKCSWVFTGHLRSQERPSFVEAT